MSPLPFELNRSGPPSRSGEFEILWAQTLDLFADKVAVFYADGSPALRFRNIEELANKTAARLVAMDAQGCSVALRLPNCPDWPAVLLGIWKAGAAPVLLPADFSTGRTLEISRLIGCVAEIVKDSGAIVFRELPVEKTPRLPGVALWKVTSGTTGIPRLIAFSADQILADARQIISTMEITPADRNFALIPFSHSYGFSNLITPLLFFGTPVVVATDALPRSLANALVQSEATIWPAVPAFFPGLVSLGFRPAGALRRVISAGAPLAARVAQVWLEQTGLRIHGFYGSSECGGICFDREGCAHEADAWVGTPMDGVSLEFFPLSERASAEGTLRVCSAANGMGIFPSAPDDPLRDGAFFPSDIVIRERGGYRIVGRLSDTINIGAKKVHPYEIERALLNLPGVTEAVVFGIPAAGGRGEAIAAAICGNPAPDERSLREALAHSLPAWKIPRSFFFLDKLPFNSRGKLNRRELACALVGQQANSLRCS